MSEKGMPKSEKIAERLEQMIIEEARYQPNEQIPNERTLAQMLGVSRASVREAIKILTGNGILIVRRGIGTFVAEKPGFVADPFHMAASKNKENLLEMWYQVRLMLEPEYMRLVIENITPEELLHLKQLEQNCANKIQYGENYAKEDTEFHLCLAKATHNEILERFMAGVEESVFPGVELEADAARKNALENHRLVVQYIELKDVYGAYNAMRMHLLLGQKEIQNRE